MHRLARETGVAGWVLNDGEGVLIEAEGSGLDRFAAELVGGAPPLARVESLTVEAIEPLGETTFRILASVPSGRSAAIPADVATCDDCLRELFDPDDRRYRYPFVNCTNCGPRFTIVRSVPYDRPNTTMAGFPMCPDCRREYEDPDDRRFHAEPVACPVCGPRLSMPLDDAIALLREGAILAVKGLGGYHLACDATNESAVARLRARKHREEKPLAVMTADPDALAVIDAGGASAPGGRAAADRPRSAPRGRTRCGVGRAGEPLARRDAPLHPAPPPSLQRSRPAARDDERQPLRRADRLPRRRGPQAAGRDRRRLPRQRPAHPPPLRGLGRLPPLPDPAFTRLRPAAASARLRATRSSPPAPS